MPGCEASSDSVESPRLLCLLCGAQGSHTNSLPPRMALGGQDGPHCAARSGGRGLIGGQQIFRWLQPPHGSPLPNALLLPTQPGQGGHWTTLQGGGGHLSASSAAAPLHARPAPAGQAAAGHGGGRVPAERGHGEAAAT